MCLVVLMEKIKMPAVFGLQDAHLVMLLSTLMTEEMHKMQSGIWMVWSLTHEYGFLSNLLAFNLFLNMLQLHNRFYFFCSIH